INVWVYTKEFAERFGMPEKWVSGELEGAHGAAFRVETSSSRLMFSHKREGVSKPVRRCVLDLFLPTDADIPWANEKVADIWWYTPDAPTYLMPQREKDEQWQRRPVGLSGRALVRYEEAGFGGLIVRKFRKKLYPGVDYLSLSMTCTTPGDGVSNIEFRPEGTSRRNADAVIHKVRLPESFMQKLYAEWKAKSRNPSQGEYEEILGK
ncbi:hypothetical protein, partial [Thiohalorhabdus sp.]